MYKLTTIDVVLRIGPGGTKVIHTDRPSVDYAEYQLWLAEGNIPLPAVMPTEPIVYPKTIDIDRPLCLVGQSAIVIFRAEPKQTFKVVVDSVEYTITTDENGEYVVAYTPSDRGTYIIKGGSLSPLSTVVVKIEAV